MPFVHLEDTGGPSWPDLVSHPWWLGGWSILGQFSVLAAGLLLPARGRTVDGFSIRLQISKDKCQGSKISKIWPSSSKTERLRAIWKCPLKTARFTMVEGGLLFTVWGWCFNGWLNLINAPEIDFFCLQGIVRSKCNVTMELSRCSETSTLLVQTPYNAQQQNFYTF